MTDRLVEGHRAPDDSRLDSRLLASGSEQMDARPALSCHQSIVARHVHGPVMRHHPRPIGIHEDAREGEAWETGPRVPSSSVSAITGWQRSVQSHRVADHGAHDT